MYQTITYFFLFKYVNFYKNKIIVKMSELIK